MAKVRLQKILASAGIDSRRNCEDIILSGAVCVNKKVVDELPAFADPDEDLITVNGKKIRSEKKVYYLLNKPKGVICTNKDPQGRKKAIDLIPSKERIFCVGRLDYDTTGAIILTNDSILANQLTHPKYEINKTYIATVKGKIEGQAIETLKQGIWLAEGKTRQSSIKVLNRGHNQSGIEIVIRQGKKRQIRRMLAKVGCKVKTLKRTKIGNIDLKGLGTGKFRPLTKSEVNYLKKATKPKKKS